MTPNLIQRHQTYVLGPNQDGRLASVAAGATITAQLELDPDAPFLLRSRSMRVKYDSATVSALPARRQTNLNHLLLRWAGPKRDYRCQNYVRQSLMGPYFGQLGNPIPVAPQVVYPRQSTIEVQLQNDGAAALTNLTLYFHGVKLFSPGAVKAYEYPAINGLLPFAYPIGLYKDSDGLTLVRNVAVTQGPLRQIFRCKPDADFVLRGGQAGSPFALTPVNEVFVTVRDEDEKPYSNDAVHMDVMFGNSNAGSLVAGTTAGVLYPVGTSTGIPPVGCGPASPGLFFPEIYIPKNHLFYVDVSRADVSYAGAVVVDIPISLIGQKVFQK